MSTESLRVVGPKAAKRAIRKAMKHRRPLFVWGPMGIGKSDVVKQLGQEQNREVIDVRLPLWEPTDIKGIPYFDSNTSSMKWAPPIELPQDPNSTAILFLDELNTAPPAVQAAAYQLVLNRRVGAYRLPDGVDIVAAGNRDGDRGVTYRMPAPLANRFVHIEMKADFDDFNEWAIENQLHSQVIGYLNYAKSDLFDFDPKTASRSFATPRSWSFVSELLQDDDAESDESTLTDLVSGAIGDGLAVKFMAHRKIVGKLPKPIDVLTGKTTTLEVKEISAMYSLITEMCYELKSLAEKKDKEWNTYADNFFGFAMANLPTELVVMGAKVALSNFNLPIDPSKMKNFDQFHRRFGRYVLSAMSC